MSAMQDHRGILVCFEGGDGAGKTTLAASVVDELQQRGFDPLFVDKKSTDGFDEPYLSVRMKDLRKVLWDYPPEAPLWEWGDWHWLYLILTWFSVLDRCKIQPLLQQGRVVVIDNWYYKFAARFLLKPELDRQHVLACFRHLTDPDLVVLVDVDPRIAVTRRSGFSATESGRMDGYAKGGPQDFVDYQTRVLEELKSFCGEAWVHLDASHRTMEDLVSDASEVVGTAVAQWRGNRPRLVSRTGG